MASQSDRIRVVREGEIARVFVVPGITPQRITFFAALVLAGISGLAVGVYLLVINYRQTLELDFDSFTVALVGAALLGWSLLVRPRQHAWTHQFVFDGEAVYCIDPSGQSKGARERLEDLELAVAAPSGFAIVGKQGQVGQRISMEDGLAVLVQLQRAHDASARGRHEQSRLIGAGPGTARNPVEASMLPRQGVTGVNPSRKVFWPLSFFLLVFPVLFMFFSALTFAGGEPSIGVMFLGVGLLGLAVAVPAVWYLNRRRLSSSGSLLPERIRFTASSVRVEQGRDEVNTRRVIEIPFAQLHSVDVLDPEHDGVSRVGGANGVAGSGLVFVHGASQDIIEGRAGTRTVVLPGIGRTDALELRDLILMKRDRWRARHAT